MCEQGVDRLTVLTEPESADYTGNTETIIDCMATSSSFTFPITCNPASGNW